MRIVYVIEKLSDRGGMERVLTDKMNYLAERTAHEVIMLLVWHDKAAFAYALNPKVRVIRLNVPQSLGVMAKALALIRFRRKVRELNPTLTLYTWVMGAFLAAWSGWKGVSVYEAHRARPTMKHPHLLTQMEQKVDAVVALTAQDAGQYPRAKRVEVISNFTMLKPWRMMDHQQQRCLAIGRLIDVKDFARLLRIWKCIEQRFSDWELDIVGDGPEKAHLEAQISEEHLQHVHLHPATTDIIRYYQNSSICLMTSRFEGLPMVLIEAMTCGLPLVALDCDYGPRHLIKDGQNGYLIAYQDDQAMVEAISRLMQNRPLREMMGQKALQDSLQYQPSAVMNQWLKLFKQLCRH